MMSVPQKAASGPRSDDYVTAADRKATLTCRFSGPTADELLVLCRPARASREARVQAESAYRALRDTLQAEGFPPSAIVSETVFFSEVGTDIGAAMEARRQIFGEEGGASVGPPITWIGQPPLDEGNRLQISAVVVSPHRRDTCSSSNLTTELSCTCDVCRCGARARMFRIGEESHFRAANILGCGRSGFDEAYDMFRVASGLLAQGGMSFHDVQRTWIYLRDIDRDYDTLNAARRAFFRDCGIERRPASTGVQGTPPSDGHDFAMTLYAMKSSEPLDVESMSTPTLNEAWTYGADFSRGLRITDANKVTLHISGTASIDETGRTVHIGDFPAQVDRMLHNIETLLAAQGAAFANVVSAVAYLKRPSDAPALREMFTNRGFDGFPCALVQAPLCRPELLCETELVAVLPLAP
jgi:enamine deaminase RidA (YjgF/YER057c/UK114 family)